MEIAWLFSRPGCYQRHRPTPGVAKERPRRIGSRRAIEKEQRRSSCCQHHWRDDDGDHHHHHDHRRQCVSSCTALARTLSAIAVSLVLISPTATAAASGGATATAGAATSATAAIHLSPRSPSDTAASPAGHDNAVAEVTAYETETDPASASAELGASRASRKPPPLLRPSDPPPPRSAPRSSTPSFNRIEEGTIDSSRRESCCASWGGGGRDCEYDEYYDCAVKDDDATGAAAVPVCCRRPAAEFLAQAVDERDDERGECVALAAPAVCGGGGSADYCSGVSNGDEVDCGDDGAAASSSTSGHNVEQEFDNVGQESRTATSASDPLIPAGDAEPPAAAVAADDSELEVEVDPALTPIPTTPLPAENDAGAGTTETEALANGEERDRELNAAALRARAGESVAESVDVGGSIHREGGGGGGGGEATVATAPSRQIGGGGFPKTTTTATDPDAVTVPARRGSRRTPLAKTGGCGSKGQSPALGSWAEEQSDEEEEGLPRQGGGDGEPRKRPADGEAHAVTTCAGVGVVAAEGVTVTKNDDLSQSSGEITYGKEDEAGEGARHGLNSEAGLVEEGALHEEPGRSEGVVSVESVGGAREYAEVGPGVDGQGAAGAASAAAAGAPLDIEPAQLSAVPEMSPTPHTRTGFHEADVLRAEGTRVDTEDAGGEVFERAGGEGEVESENDGMQQQTTTSTRRRGKGGWGWSAPGGGGGRQGFGRGGGGGGGGGNGRDTWRKAVIALVAGAAILMTFAQGSLPRWFPLVGGDLRDGWALDLPPPGSRRGSLLSGRGVEGLAGRTDEPPMPDLVWDEETETAPPLPPRIAANATHDVGDHEDLVDVPLKWDTRPKPPEHLVFDPVLGVVPTGVLNAWKRTNRSGKGGGGGGGGAVGRVEEGRTVPGLEVVGGRGESGDRNESATGASSTRRGSSSSSSSNCPAGTPPAVGWKAGKTRPLPPVRYTPEWHAWCAAREEAGDLDELSEAAQLRGFPLPKSSHVTASGDRKAGGGDETGVGVGVGVVAVGKANPQPPKQSTTPAAIGLQHDTAVEASGVNQADAMNGGAGGSGDGGGGGNDGDGNFGENYLDETRDGRSSLSAPASAHPPPMVSRVA